MEYYSLFQLNNLIRATLDTHMDPTYWVVAEVSDWRPNQSGHCYLELVEKEGHKVIAKSRATIWAGQFRSIKSTFESQTNATLKAGIKILCEVSIQFHELYGFSFNVKQIDSNYTLGEKARAKQEVITALKEAGLIDKNKTVPLPLVVQRLAIITSPTAAGYEDFLEQLQKNGYGYSFQTELFPAIMQGDDAVRSIAKTIDSIPSENFDAIVIIRGGGSQIDLDCYDQLPLAEAIANAPLSVLVGVGHERDESVADLVAFASFKTPTAVAEFVVQKAAQFELRLDQFALFLEQHAKDKLNRDKRDLEQLSLKLKYVLENKIQIESNKLMQFSNALKQNSKRQLLQFANNLRQYEKNIHHLDPENILKKGYSISKQGGKQIKESIDPNLSLETITSHAIVISTIDKIKKRNEK